MRPFSRPGLVPGAGGFCYGRVMAQITNLNRFRKDKARAEKRRLGDENAAKHGRTKAQKAAEKAEAERAVRTLDQHRRDDD